MLLIPALVLALCLDYRPTPAEFSNSKWQWQELYTLPAKEELDRFPGDAVCEDAVKFLENRVHWLDAMQDLHRQAMYVPWFTGAREDLAKRREVWLLLDEARRWHQPKHYASRSWCDLYVRRDLAKLKELLGEEDYNAGVMPGFVGVAYWRHEGGW